MPLDVIMGETTAPGPNEADIKALEAWINSFAGQAASCETHKFVTNKDIVALIVADLEKLPRPRASATRYLKSLRAGSACLNVTIRRRPWWLIAATQWLMGFACC
jgi:hypothetical protein